MHSRHCVAEACMEHTVLLEIRCHPSEHVVLGHISPIKVSDHDPLLGVQLLQILQMVELLNRILQLFLHELGEGFHGSRPAIFPLRRLSIADNLQRGVLGDVKPRRHRRFPVAIHFTHDDPTTIGEGFFHL